MPHHRLLIILLLTLPFIELYLLIRIGALLGFFSVLIWILIAATLGLRLLQFRSWTIWHRLQLSVSRGEHPAREMVDGAIVMIGALLLIIPGFITDLLGLLCLIPVSRNKLAGYIQNHGDILLNRADRQTRDPDFIEGEFRRDDD